MKVCIVCGDKGIRLNYSAFTCESCKVFFHRNASMELKCRKDGKCKIDFVSRKSCPKCRLDKCFARGMRLRLPKSFNGKTVPQVVSSEYENLSELSSVESVTEESEMLEENLDHKIDTLDSSNLDLYIETVVQQEAGQNYNLPDLVLHSIIDPIGHNLPQLPYIAGRKRKYALELIGLERHSIMDIQSMLNSVFVDESKLPIIGQVYSLLDSFNLSGLYARKIVSFCKRIPAFKQLAHDDQLLVMKPFFFDILTLRNSFLVDRHNGGYPIITNEYANQAYFVHFSTFDQFKDQDFAQDIHRFQLSLHEGIENDFTIRDLLIALLLFKPKENTAKPEFIRYHYMLYCRLLRRYLEHKYQKTDLADQKFTSLMQLAAKLNYFRQRMRYILPIEMDLHLLPPVMVEASEIIVR